MAHRRFLTNSVCRLLKKVSEARPNSRDRVRANVIENSERTRTREHEHELGRDEQAHPSTMLRAIGI
jgi:hypothetical protein